MRPMHTHRKRQNVQLMVEDARCFRSNVMHLLSKSCNSLPLHACDLAKGEGHMPDSLTH